ncbi:branched-chain amino acid ABC transporter permease [Haloferax mediterranei ATCC 33500]|uniref:Branched chain amino acid transporter permease protein n=1 Tax=Haloferax mediterranei (strain ATCC 33500 / DSM 1411 / JCM 8866 / NBRC 14739 / NCIMB 2177 / R-4) TaxID=523841 RepID=I3R3V6_HALMT|nr:branched-chain amino acid ABC transporter permease [Haloferax mediterranei]AFK18916.1 branched chain amino acid transporter permease protein [Haloferax mediterranei ATCC 33500]AHZ21721.1 branched-chain amino acid ABC transporter permease [Haloferax mediterranei ATCC 33500]EMA03225.1 branched chain amino acid transporter permease protein [Haloferax mediterranei ATCC 33500]MDX5989009.1 branched-chain amino acid ABC transporter permease [Haloferax mediterranei ATCC 33500]QCQ75402.1 branched-ch
MIPLQISPFQYVVNGVVFSSIIVLAAIGLSLVYSIADFANFAHGDLMTVGAFSALFSVAVLQPALGDMGLFGLPLWFFLALVIGMGAAAIIAVLTDRFIYQPMEGTESIGLLISSIGVALVYRALVFLSFGTDAERYGVPRQGPIPWIQESFGVAVTPRNLVVVALTVVLVTALHLTLTRTTLGRKMRATADNADLARVSGIRTSEVIIAMWLIGGALAAAGGVFLGLEELVRPRMGFDILLIVFAAVILGGIGSVYGAMLGGLVIGMVHELVPLFNQWGVIPVGSRYAAAVAFVIMVAILLVRPSGIAGDSG